MQANQLFQMSYLSADAAVYFNRVLLVSSLAQHPDAQVATLREAFFGFLKTQGRHYVGNIQRANHYYLELGLPALDLPKFPNDYFTWIGQFRKNLRDKIGSKNSNAYLFDFSYSMASLSGDIALLQWSLQLHATAPAAPNQRPQMESLINSVKDNKFRMPAPAMLLATEDAYRFIWQEWKSLEALLDQLLAFELPEKPEVFQQAIDFCDALLAKFRERAAYIQETLAQTNS